MQIFRMNGIRNMCVFVIPLILFFSSIFTVICTISFVAFCVFTLTACLPAKQSSHSWPCQRDKVVRPLLSDALVYSRHLARTISVLSNTVVNDTKLLLKFQFVYIKYNELSARVFSDEVNTVLFSFFFVLNDAG